MYFSFLLIFNTLFKSYFQIDMTAPKYKIQLEKPIPPPPPPPPVYNGRGPSTTFNMPQAPVANPNNQHFQYNMTIPELLPPPPGAQPPPAVSYTHLTLPTTERV